MIASEFTLRRGMKIHRGINFATSAFIFIFIFIRKKKKGAPVVFFSFYKNFLGKPRWKMDIFEEDINSPLIRW